MVRLLLFKLLVALGLAAAIFAPLSTAAAEKLTCQECGKSIVGIYRIKDGKSYHDSCFASSIADHCAYCEKPIVDSSYLLEQQVYHLSCYRDHVALRCAFCSEIITGHYSIDLWGNGYHQAHEKQEKKCFCCHSYRDADFGGSPEGTPFYLCGRCLPSAVTTIQEADSIVAEVRASLAQLGIIIQQKKIKLQLVTPAEIEQLMPSGRTGHLGVTIFSQKSAFGGLLKEKDVRIAVLRGLSAVSFRLTIAHELMHVWQYTNAPLRNDPAWCEGSCNYAAYLVLSSLGTPEANGYITRMEQDADQVYGEGFRKVREFAEENGMQEWLAALRSRSTPPW